MFKNFAICLWRFKFKRLSHCRREYLFGVELEVTRIHKYTTQIVHTICWDNICDNTYVQLKVWFYFPNPRFHTPIIVEMKLEKISSMVCPNSESEHTAKET